MIRGMFNAASGMMVNQEKLDITSNNLANVNTTAYKKDQGVQRSFREVLISRIEGGEATPIGASGNGVILDGSYTDHNQGGLRQTGNTLDVAIEGQGFFVVQSPNGLRYTRDGNFTLNEQGQIVTQQGYPVMGERGPLQTIQGQAVNIGTDGQLYLGEIRGDNFRIVEFPDNNQLVKEGDNFFTTEGDIAEPAADYQIKQGYLERSNVNIVQEMVQMIQLNRHFEANQKVITTIDNTLEKAVNSVGRLA
ncbi:MAG: flagellar basal-body rod protein FlgF [Halanaerobiales bacterium]